VAVDVTLAFAAYFARNRGPVADNAGAMEPPSYGVSARLDGSTVELALTFRAGAAYCCYEWGCHLALGEGKRWGWLRSELASRGIAAPDRLELRLAVAVEAGALFFDYARPLPGQRGRYELSPSAAVQYQAVVTEGGGQDAEPHATADRGGIGGS
jgi:hypothetical protein